MLFIMILSRASTSSLGQLRRMLFWAISRPDVATPPALEALPGAYWIPFERNTSMASGVEGMLAPSATSFTPPFTRFWASLPLISFWVALGKAQSALWAQRGL